MYLRNLGLMILIAGGLHLFFHTFRAQGDRRKFDTRDLVRNDARFFTGNQTRDNIFWSCTSGVGIWTAYEVIMMWGYANGWFPHFLVWHENPVLFVAWFLIIPFWSAVHFYVIHRLLHWKPLFRIAHALHHRNVTVGPWSGLSMHPIEHLIYLSGVFIHAAVLSHPVHVLFHGQYNTLQAATSHTGFDSILVRGKPVHYAGSLLPHASPSLLQLQLRQPAGADGQVVRQLPRRYPRDMGQVAPPHGNAIGCDSTRSRHVIHCVRTIPPRP